ncbi:unnamed protein product [Bursaphelenchus okinawaensis]|uniref:Uncharacterized protein n=1 Tax=Bursaphelenchus okinawaensis TaxID=465554 RepID=A0A811JSR4_9BILA|nr:unnamed protein product [Bursaphelenchus okinawaensis]CAG9081312.1 unnamed protein product [Bursaphelenchus okinawaensis]
MNNSSNGLSSDEAKSLAPAGVICRLKKLCDLFEHSHKNALKKQAFEIINRLDVLHKSVYSTLNTTKTSFRKNKERALEPIRASSAASTSTQNESLVNGVDEVSANGHGEIMEQDYITVEDSQTTTQANGDGRRSNRTEQAQVDEHEEEALPSTSLSTRSSVRKASTAAKERIVKMGIQKASEKKILKVVDIETAKKKETENEADWHKGVENLLADIPVDNSDAEESAEDEENHKELGASDLSDHPEDFEKKKKQKSKKAEKPNLSDVVDLSSDDDIPLVRRGQRKGQRMDLDDSDEEEQSPKKASNKKKKNAITSEDEGDDDDDEEEDLDEEESESDDDSEESAFGEDEELEELLRPRPRSDDEDVDSESGRPQRRSRRLAKSQDVKEQKTASFNARKRKRPASSDSSSDDLFDRDDEARKNESQESVIQKLNPLEDKKRKRRRRVIVDTDEELEEDEEDQKDDEADVKKKKEKAKKGRLCKDTREAEKEERERVKRLAEKQKDFNGIVISEDPETLGKCQGGVVAGPVQKIMLDDDRDSEDSQPVQVPPELVRVLKQHQAMGIKFLYDLTIEDLKRVELPGGGGILAHCMGLGKTLQVIAFLYTILSHPKINKVVRKAMVVVPKNVVINWQQEFEKWVFENGLGGIDIVAVDGEKDMERRYQMLQNWQKTKCPAVLIIGYEMYRILVTDPFTSNKKGQKPKPTPARRLHKKLLSKLQELLQDPGPEIVVCDEGHKLKNDESKQSIAMSGLKTRRRVCLTGTPMQNNLIEYHCMVNFVKPGLLGTKKEFTERFVNVIKAGQTNDASVDEILAMKRRCHVLHQKLQKVVDRQDYRVLTQFIPPKQEYIIHIRLTEKQIQLYRAYVSLTMSDRQTLHKRHLSDYHTLSRIWTHPYQLVANSNKKLAKEDDDDSFIDDDSDDSEEVSRPARRRNADAMEEAVDEEEFTIPLYWYDELGIMEDGDKDNFALSNKLIVLQDIIKACEQIGDKLLIFSQSLESLSLIKYMLETLDEKWFEGHEPLLQRNNEKWGWDLGKDFFIISGKVNAEDRERVQKRFNDSTKPRARVCLISTKAGSLGTNMVAANRVVVFDACWNPSHDTQALFRAYRYGQTKPVYVYRLVADGTMEDVIYKRQVTKDSTALRVVDEKQVKSWFKKSDLAELYHLDIHEYRPDLKRALNPPKDRVLGDIIINRPETIYNYEERDTLLKHVVEEVLTDRERRAAWLEYEKDRSGPRLVQNVSGLQMQHSEREFLIEMARFVNNQINRNQVMIDPLSSALGKQLMDHGCEYQQCMGLQILYMGFQELIGKAPAQVKQEYPELVDPVKFVMDCYLSHPPKNAYELTMLDCRNKFKDLHRKYSHLNQLKTSFNFLARLSYLLTDYVAAPAPPAPITI